MDDLQPAVSMNQLRDVLGIPNDSISSEIALAEVLRKPQSFVAKYEGGERLLDVIELIRILKALDVDESRFIATLVRGD